MFDMQVLPNQPLIKFNRQLPMFNWHYPMAWGEGLIEDRLAPFVDPKAKEVRRRAVYIHIPFCDRICNFCPFDRNTYQSASEVDDYVEALLAEIDLKATFLGRPKVDAVFVGGGTPSILEPRHIESLGESILRNFDLTSLKEFSFEVEVKSVSVKNIQSMRDIGVDRISFGAQTFSNKFRTLLNLDASLEQIEETAALINSVFPYTNVDVLYGIAGQSVGELTLDLESAIALQTTTIDLYPLNNLSASAAMHRNMTEAAMEFLPAATRIQYRMHIDRFFKGQGYIPINGYGYARSDVPGRENIGPIQRSRIFLYHDILYGYHDDEILGYGSSALSQIPGYNMYNFRNRQKYIKEVLSNRTLPHHAFGPIASPERGVVFFPYRGELDKARIHWEELPAETFAALRAISDAGLIVDRGDRHELTESGWLFYVNMMFYLMPTAGRQCISNLIDQQHRRGRRCGSVDLTELALPLM